MKRPPIILTPARIEALADMVPALHPVPPVRACKQCLYWKPRGTHRHIGICQRYPKDLPNLRTPAQYWCGEWATSTKRSPS